MQLPKFCVALAFRFRNYPSPRIEMRTKTKRAVGRPEYQPSEKDRGAVEAYVRVGYGEETIASLMGVATTTLRKHYDYELEHARHKFLAAVTQGAGNLALGRPAEWSAPDPQTGRRYLVREEQKPDGAMQRYIMSSLGRKYGWGEQLKLVAERNNVVTLRFENMKDDELAQLAERLDRLIETGPATNIN